ncbi:MAG TPA: prepilin-type N-terminal cleavage/methylation domain-containing protein [Gemmatimonadaceae bacterium]|jgi:prepilin-type N-terminal cleavage/methylation domain-containing protein|nr:prepilin-type N-terminal cleavage/methylation domain-containing protein [Gemmatimonadaceae bacterium]
MNTTLTRRLAVRARRARRGMTLAEVMVAMMLLTTVMFALGAFTARFAMANSQARLVVSANEIAGTKLDAIHTQPTYAAIDALADSVTVKRDYTDFTIVTKVKRIGGAPTDSTDYKLMTVTVTHPAMKKSVMKTTAMAAF